MGRRGRGGERWEMGGTLGTLGGGGQVLGTAEGPGGTGGWERAVDGGDGGGGEGEGGKRDGRERRTRVI